MNIVILLSRTFDFSPLYPQKVPLELFGIEKAALYTRLRQTVSEYFEDANIIILDPSEKPVFYQMDNSDNVISIPGLSVFGSLFLFSSYVYHESLPGFSVLIQGNMLFENIEEIAENIRAIQKDAVLSSGLTLLANPWKNQMYAYEADYQITSPSRFKTLKIKNPVWGKTLNDLIEQKKTDHLYAMDGIVAWNALKFPEMLSHLGDDYRDYFFEVIEGWKRSVELPAMLKQGDLLEKVELSQWIANLEFSAIRPIRNLISKANNPRELVQLLQNDGAGNYKDGASELLQASGNIVVNRTDRVLKVEGLNHSLVIATEDEVRIKGL